MQLEFRIGETVWFKPEHRDYAMRHYKSMGPFVIYDIDGTVAWMDSGDRSGAYLYRLQHSVFLEAAMKAIADAS